MICTDHPKYGGLRSPRTGCPKCLEVYNTNKGTHKAPPKQTVRTPEQLSIAPTKKGIYPRVCTKCEQTEKLWYFYPIGDLKTGELRCLEHVPEAGEYAITQQVLETA